MIKAVELSVESASPMPQPVTNVANYFLLEIRRLHCELRVRFGEVRSEAAQTLSVLPKS